MPASRAQQAEAAERRAKLIALRRAGIHFDDPRILALGYKSRQAASKDLIRALRKHRDEEATEVSIYRQQENERLDALLAAIWPHATNPVRLVHDPDNPDAEPEEKFDPRAVETAIRLLDRRAKLNGLDMPVKTEVSGPDGNPIPLSDASLDTLNKLISISGRTGPIDAANPDDAVPDTEDPGGEEVV